MSDLLIDLKRFSDNASIEAFVTFESTYDADWHEIGEQIVWRPYRVTEWTANYFVDGVHYTPTEDELKDFEDEIELLVERRAAA